MHHKCHIQFLKCTSILDHSDLSADALLRRSSINRDRIRFPDLCVLQRLSGSQDRWSLHMMSAGMSDSRKSVILTEQSDIRSALTVTVDSLKRGLDTDNSSLYREAFLLQPVRKNFLRMKLLQPDLRMVKNIIRHSRHFIPDPINIPEHDFFQHKKHLRCLIPQ